MRLDNDSEEGYTVVHLEADSRPGLLSSLTNAFSDLGLEVLKAQVDGSSGRIQDTFHVQTADGTQVSGADALINIKRSIEVRSLTSAAIVQGVGPPICSLLVGKPCNQVGCRRCAALVTDPSFLPVAAPQALLWSSRVARGEMQMV